MLPHAILGGHDRRTADSARTAETGKPLVSELFERNKGAISTCVPATRRVIRKSTVRRWPRPGIVLPERSVTVRPGQEDNPEGSRAWTSARGTSRPSEGKLVWTFHPPHTIPQRSEPGSRHVAERNCWIDGRARRPTKLGLRNGPTSSAAYEFLPIGQPATQNYGDTWRRPISYSSSRRTAHDAKYPARSAVALSLTASRRSGTNDNAATPALLGRRSRGKAHSRSRYGRQSGLMFRSRARNGQADLPRGGAAAFPKSDIPGGRIRGRRSRFPVK
jgi:hypothetical protein